MGSAGFAAKLGAALAFLALALAVCGLWSWPWPGQLFVRVCVLQAAFLAALDALKSG